MLVITKLMGLILYYRGTNGDCQCATHLYQVVDKGTGYAIILLRIHDGQSS